SDVVELGDAEPSGEGESSFSMRIRDRRLEAGGQMGAAHAEITGVLYMSALEVAAKIGAPPPERCAGCGELQYKISRRVTDLLASCGGENLARVAREYYGQRSRYLHEGMLLAAGNYMGTSVPQLDPSSPSGCRMQVASPSLNLRE